MTKFLHTILNQLPLDEFWKRHWEQAPLHTSGDVSRFAPLPDLPELASVESLLATYRSPVMVLGSLAIRETEGLSDRVAVLPGRALELYREGATLEFDCLDMYLPKVRKLVEQMGSSLNLPAGTFSKAVGYLSAPGSGVSPHFDAYVNFVLHLRGVKKWSLLPNTTAERPLEHFALNELPFIPEELSTYWKHNPPENYAKLASDVNVQPGDLLFLPRGTWHSTEAIVESFSLHFTFSVPTWMEVALESLRLKLAGRRELRAFANGTSEDRKLAEQVVASVLRDVPPEQLMKIGQEPYDKYQVANAVFRQVLQL